MQGMTFRHGRVLADRQRRRDARLLVLREDVDAALVTLFTRPRSREEGVDDGKRLLGGVHTAADADQLRIVVLAGQPGRLQAPGQCTPRTRHLVRGYLLAIATAT